VVIAPASRIVEKRAKTERQDSWWASCSQGFESLPRRQFALRNWFPKNHASRENVHIFQKKIHQHTTTLTPTQPNMATMLTEWHNPSPHTQTANKKSPIQKNNNSQSHKCNVQSYATTPSQRPKKIAGLKSCFYISGKQESDFNQIKTK
jgi:hypothetical protein